MPGSDLIGTQLGQNGQEAQSSLFAALKRVLLTLRLSSVRHRPDHAVAESDGYFKDFSVLTSVTAPQRAYSRSFGHRFDREAVSCTTEDLQHQIEELLPASFLLLPRFTATQIATAPERHQVVGHQAQ